MYCAFAVIEIVHPFFSFLSDVFTIGAGQRFTVESLCMSNCMPLVVFVAYITNRPILFVRYCEKKKNTDYPIFVYFLKVQNIYKYS